MNVCVFGLWHLGCVTAACLASAGHTVVGLDTDAATIDGLSAGTPPLLEPGLESMIRRELASGRLRFTTDRDSALAAAGIVWVTFDTPVDDDDRADVDCVVRAVASLFPALRDGVTVLVSSQLPVGTTRRLEAMFADEAAGRRAIFAYSPENLRLGRAIEVFTNPDRVIVGVRREADRAAIAALLQPITTRIEWMSVESAEMTKHALNAFLATSVTFINEIAALCERVGADASEVERGLKTEARIGPRAYLSPGGAFAGGTLARDVVFLSQLGRDMNVPTDMLAAVKTSNDVHRQWAARRLSSLLGDVKGRTIAIWGLTYKPGTDTLRRSSAVELAQWLHAQGAQVRAHDPAVKTLPDSLSAVLRLSEDPLAALEGAAALVVATPWPVYKEVDVRAAVERMTQAVVLDANRFLGATLGAVPGVRYFSVGRAAA
jgi:UDPglucose 6-dehydrogenase